MNYLILSIDTECDKDDNWLIRRPMSYTNVTHGIQERLTPLFKRYNIKPTYLISPEVLKNKESVEALKTIDNCELGTHLHCEFIEPFADLNCNSTLITQNTLSYDLEFQKIKNLTNLFKSQFNYPPLSFRAGRFGISSNTISILSRLGYLVDSSVVPFRLQNYNGINQSFFGAPLKPYYPSINDYNKRGDSSILEVPLSHYIIGFDKWPAFMLKRLPDYNNLLIRVLKKLGKSFEKTWIRPYRLNGLGLINATKELMRTYFKNDEHTLINMMFHSNEIMPNCSPYCKNETEIDNYINSLDKYFFYLFTKHQVQSISLNESIKFFKN